MIKKVIFDIDNTLLDTTKDCLTCYQKYLGGNYKKLYDLIEKYDSEKRSYEYNDLKDYVVNNLNITNELFDEIFNYYGSCATLINKDTPKILEELSKNVEIVALSKWYVKHQENRLKKVGILKYFRHVYGIENAGLKPSEESFKVAAGNTLLSECLVVGDSIQSDIRTPLKLGMKTLLFNSSSKKYYTIKSLSEVIDFVKK